MAIKKYIAKVTGVHALTGKYIEKGKEYELDERLAGSEIFEPVPPVPEDKPQQAAPAPSGGEQKGA